MDIPLDQFGARRAGLSAWPDRVVSPIALDWPGLAGRLAAAHAARQVLTVPSGDTASGSFAPGVARAISDWSETASRSAAGPSSPDVNRNAKADGKPAATISPNCAGDDRSHVRGLL